MNVRTNAGTTTSAGLAALPTVSTLVAAVLLAGCAGGSGTSLAPVPGAEAAAFEAPDRSQRPAVGELPDLRLPAAQRFRLSNGLDVLLLEKHDVPLVQTNLIVRAGSADEPAGLEGLAGMTSSMLDQGAAGRSALEIADAFEYIGARFFRAAGPHTTTLGLRVPTARWDEGLGLLADVLLRPDFPAEELERLRLDRLTSLIRAHDQPAAVADVLFDRTLYGTDHPYGRPALVESGLRAINVDHIGAFHDRHIRPDNATLVVVGAVDASTARQRLEAALGEWQPRHDSHPSLPPAPAQVRGRTVYLVDHPGAAQSVIQIGRIGVARTTEDYYALEVMNTILGGSFTSRLNQNLREDKGYTYGARSAFSYRPVEGPFMATAAVQTDVTGPALAEFMNELRAIRDPIPEEEVALARNFLAARFPGGFQSVGDITASMGEIVTYNLPDDYFNTYVDRILAVTAADVERVARRYVDPDHLAIIVVGDRQVIEEQVRQQGLGPVELLEVTDVLGAVPILTGAR
jgi:zinc protease